MDKNKFLEQLLENKEMYVLLDTNFFIPPHNINIKDFDTYWVDKLLSLFKGFMIHESVKNEMIGTRLSAYANKLTVCYNCDLSHEEACRYKFIHSVIVNQLNVGLSKKGKNVGEAETLSYMYAKRFPTVISRDTDIIDNICSGSVGVLMNGEYGVIHFYELLYVLRKLNAVDNKILKAFFKAFYPTGVEDGQNKVRIAFSELVRELDMVYGEDYVKVMKLV